MRKKILFIEDEEDAHLVMRGLLQKAGYGPEQILGCHTLGETQGIDGAELEVIITDLSLPDSDYHDTLKAVCRRFPYAPIIVLTGRDEPGLAVKTIQQGGQDYLVKGAFNPAMLTKSIQYAIERNRIRHDYARLFHESPVPMYIYDRESYRILAVNEAAMQSYGYTRAEFLAKTALNLRPSEDITAFENRNLDVPNTYQDAGRWRHVKRNGDIFHVHIYAFGGEHNGRKAVTVLAIDIDKKVRMEQDLREKVEETRSILSSITDGFYSIDRDWRFVYVNRTFERITGLSYRDVVGRHIWNVYPEDQFLRFSAAYKRAMNEGVDVHFEEYDPVHQVWVSMNVYPARNGIAIFFVDITEQKRLHQQLFIEQQNLSAVINNTTDIIWSLDKHYHVIQGNNAFWARVERITGRTREELREVDFTQGLLDVWRGYFDRAFGGEAFKVVWEDKDSEGMPTYEENSFNPIRDANNEVIGISCFSRDITEQTLHLQKIQQQNQKLMDIAWIQSHEVRRPVANILGLVQLFNNADCASTMNAEIIANLKIAATELDDVIRKIHGKADTE